MHNQVIHVRVTEEIYLDWGSKLAFLNCFVGGIIDARFNMQFVEYEPVPYEVQKKLTEAYSKRTVDVE